MGRVVVCFVVLSGVLAVAVSASAQVNQNVDFFPVVLDSPDPVEAGGVVSYEIECCNYGPGSSYQTVVLDITLPMGVPMSWSDYRALDDDARNAVDEAFLADNLSIDEHIWDDNNSSISMGDSFNNGCEGLLVQLVNLQLPAHSSGRAFFNARLPSVGGVPGVAYETADGTMVELNYGRGGCNSELFQEGIGMSFRTPAA
jgi:hypothetical protein